MESSGKLAHPRGLFLAARESASQRPRVSRQPGAPGSTAFLRRPSLEPAVQWRLVLCRLTSGGNWPDHDDDSILHSARPRHGLASDQKVGDWSLGTKPP